MKTLQIKISDEGHALIKMAAAQSKYTISEWAAGTLRFEANRQLEAQSWLKLAKEAKKRDAETTD